MTFSGIDTATFIDDSKCRCCWFLNTHKRTLSRKTVSFLDRKKQLCWTIICYSFLSSLLKRNTTMTWSKAGCETRRTIKLPYYHVYVWTEEFSVQLDWLLLLSAMREPAIARSSISCANRSNVTTADTICNKEKTGIDTQTWQDFSIDKELGRNILQVDCIKRNPIYKRVCAVPRWFSWDLVWHYRD